MQVNSIKRDAPVPGELEGLTKMVELEAVEELIFLSFAKIVNFELGVSEIHNGRDALLCSVFAASNSNQRLRGNWHEGNDEISLLLW